MSIDWNAVAEAWHSEQPHPDNPALTVGEFPLAVKLATKAKFGGHASSTEAGAFWHEFKNSNAKLESQGKQPISPEEFGLLLDRIAPQSFAFHGRPPTMDEIVRHREAEPSTVAKYYGDLPDKQYPHVPARDMAKFLAIAEPFSQQHLGRSPNKLEGARFALAGLNASGIGDYYAAVSGASRPGTTVPPGAEPEVRTGATPGTPAEKPSDPKGGQQG